MDMREFAGSRFIKLDDVRDAPLQETIADCEIGSYDRPVLTFESGNSLSLNRTNVRTLINAYGEDSHNWVGCVTELYAGQTDFKGEKTDSVLVRPITPPKPIDKTTLPPSKKPKKSVSAELNDDPYY